MKTIAQISHYSTKCDDGKLLWHSYADIPQIGRYESYMRQCDEVAAILSQPV
jgi:hypothetical protein